MTTAMGIYNGDKTHCARDHEFSGENIKKLTNSNNRVCKICHRENAKRARKAKPKRVKTPTVDLFLRKVNKTATCWLWTAARAGGRNRDYGCFGDPGGERYAHRFAYKTWKGPIQEGLTIDHLCRNTLCVNPDHLEVVTQRENVARGESFSAKNSRKTHCLRGHEYTPKNTYIQRPGQRACATCRKLFNDLQCGEIKAKAAAKALSRD